jgi:transcriptional regulator of acetoin/glycerol metabolism
MLLGLILSNYGDGGDVGAVERLRELSAKLHTAAMSTRVWDDLRHFLAFTRGGSMQAAAKALGVNQSTVQRRIAELEKAWVTAW